jgi:predicted helicase
VFKNEQKKDEMKIMVKEFFDSNHEYSREHTMFNKKPNMSRMINNICNFIPRTKFIVECLKDILKREPDRKVLILSDRRNHLECFKNILDENNIDSGFFYGGLKADVLKANEDKPVLLGTYAYVSEGFDKPGLNTMILASPKSDIIQSVGRILRDKKEDRVYSALVIDIVDKFSIFPNQAKKRLKYYESQGYVIESDLLYHSNKIVDFSGKCHIRDDVD